MNARPTRAFSLTELLVVISIILILSSLLVVGIGEFHMLAQRIRCQNNLKELNHACQMWLNEHKEKELAAIGNYGGRSNLWYKALLPYLSPAGSVAEASLVLNCPLVSGHLGGVGQDDTQYEWGGGPDILFSYDRYRSWFDFIGVVEDLRAAGWPGTIHMLERHPVTESGVFNPITNIIQDYGIFTYVDAWYGKQFTADELEAVKKFQGQSRSIFISADHYPDFTQVNNQLADYCGWGLYNLASVNRGNNGQPYQPVCDHPIGAGIELFRGYDSEGRIQLATEPAKQNQYANLVLFSGLYSGPPPDAITGTMDDGKVRLVMEANWTKFASPGWSYGGAWKDDHFRYVQNSYNWLLERSGGGDEISYGYNNQIAARDPQTGLTRPRPAKLSQVIRILDYEEFVADHDGLPSAGADDPEYYIALRHGGRANVLFMDGRVEALTLEEIKKDNWRLWNAER